MSDTKGNGDVEAQVGTPSHYLASLPVEVKQRVKALKKIQVDYFKINGQFYKEAAELENKYFAKYNELFKKRTNIVEGSYEPQENDCDYVETNEEIAEDLAKESPSDKDIKGIPSFWLTCMKNAIDGVNEYVTEEDEPLLEHLTDIQIEDAVDSFKLIFHFSANEWFSNSTLTKEFKLKLAPTEADPFNFDGPEIIAMKGCKIEWKSDSKNITTKTVTKKQKNAKSGAVRTVTKVVTLDSFFNFFSNTEWIEDNGELNDTVSETFHTDTNLGSFLRERLVPRAVLYFTGELVAFDDAYDEDEEVECDEDAGSADEEDPDFKPTKKALRRAQKQPDCKQQ